MVELKSLVAFLLTMTSLIFLSAFISLQFIDVTTAKNFCDNFSVNFQIDNDKISLEPGKGKLVTGNITNTGAENEFVVSSKSPEWVVVRPKVLQLDANGRERVYVYMSPDYGVRGNFDVKILIDAACVHLEKTIKTSVQ